METENKPAVFMSSRHQNPGAITAPTGKSEDYTLAAILGIVTLLAAIAAALLEWMEWSVISIG